MHDNTATIICIFKLISRVNSLPRRVSPTLEAWDCKNKLFGFDLCPTPLFPSSTEAEGLDISALGSFSDTGCVARKAGDIMSVYTAILAGIFSFLVTDAATLGAVWETDTHGVLWWRLQRDLRVTGAQGPCWCAIPGALRSFSHILIFIAKDPKKLR